MYDRILREVEKKDEKKKGTITASVTDDGDGYSLNITLDGDFSKKSFVALCSDIVCVVSRETELPLDVFLGAIIARNRDYDGKRSE